MSEGSAQFPIPSEEEEEHGGEEESCNGGGEGHQNYQIRDYRETRVNSLR